MNQEAAATEKTIGIIDGSTALGTQFVLASGGAECTLVEHDLDEGTLVLLDAAGIRLEITVDDWNTAYAPDVTVVVDPASPIQGPDSDEDGATVIMPSELYEELYLATQERLEAQQEYERASEIASAKRRRMAAAQKRVNAASEAIIEGHVVREDGCLVHAPLTQAVDVVDEQSWRSAALNQLHLPEGVVRALAENEPGIETVGGLADWVNTRGEFWGKDIKGIGPAGQDKIADAMEAFWQSWQQNDNSTTETQRPQR